MKKDFINLDPGVSVWHAKRLNSYDGVNKNLHVFSSPEPFGSQGELIVYPSSRRPSVRPLS